MHEFLQPLQILMCTFPKCIFWFVVYNDSVLSCLSFCLFSFPSLLPSFVPSFLPSFMSPFLIVYLWMVSTFHSSLPNGRQQYEWKLWIERSVPCMYFGTQRNSSLFGVLLASQDSARMRVNCSIVNSVQLCDPFLSALKQWDMQDCKSGITHQTLLVCRFMHSNLMYP